MSDALFDRKAMARAIELSREKMEQQKGGPFGAVIARNGQILAEGWNCVTSSNDPTAHAEVQVIRKACQSLGVFSLEGCTIYTSCEPCPMCLSAIYWARIDKIYYANTREDAAQIQFDDEFLYQEIGKPNEDRKIPIIPLMRDEAQKVFQRWEEKEDKIRY